MTNLQMEIIEELEKHSLFGIAQAARESWENRSFYYCRHSCPFELRVRIAEGNREMVAAASRTFVDQIAAVSH
jgi:hypothetical protein